MKKNTLNELPPKKVVREVTYTSEGYYDLYNTIDANKSKEFANVIHMIVS